MLTILANDLHELGNASWLVTGYLITESAFQPMVRISFGMSESGLIVNA